MGQAISYRFKRDAKGWRVFVTTDLMDVPVVTDRTHGAIGVDLNSDHLGLGCARPTPRGITSMPSVYPW